MHFKEKCTVLTPFWSDFGSAHCRARRTQSSDGVLDYNSGKEAPDSRLLEDEKGKCLEMPNAKKTHDFQSIAML